MLSLILPSLHFFASEAKTKKLFPYGLCYNSRKQEYQQHLNRLICEAASQSPDLNNSTAIGVVTSRKDCPPSF
jgi:hypothetical protein